MRATVAEIDPSLVLRDVKSMGEVMANVEAPRRFNTDLITIFAVGALLLAITGIYAVVAFSVSQRTQEIAIRMAVGAQQVEIARPGHIIGSEAGAAGMRVGFDWIAGRVAVGRHISLRCECDGFADLCRECTPNAVGGTAGVSTACNTGGGGRSDPFVANELDRCDCASLLPTRGLGRPTASASM